MRGRRFTQLKLKYPKEAESMVQAKESSQAKDPKSATEETDGRGASKHDPEDEGTLAG